MDAVAQPNPFFLQLLGKTRPRAQFDEPWISDLQSAEQMTVGPQTIGRDIRVSAIVLGTSDTKPVAEAVELFGVDRVHEEPPIEQGIDDGSMRYFDRHGDGFRRAGNRENPVTQLCQTHSTV
jgi:hypothetical protein